MDYIGREIKRIRLARKIQAKDVYDGILPRSMYYRFENKDESISYPLLFKICQRLNIDYRTLELFLRDENYHDIIEMIYFFFFNDKSKLDDYSKQLRQKFIDTGSIKYKHLAIISHNLYLKYFHNTLDEQEVADFRSYIFGMDNWNEYEAYLLINGIFLFSLDEIDSIYYRLMKTLIKFKIPHDQYVILTTSIISISYGQKDSFHFRKYMKYLIHSGEFFEYPMHTMFSKTIIKFYTLLEDNMIHPSTETKEQIQQILDFFLLVDMPQMYHIHNALFQFLLSESEKTSH